MTQVTSCQEVLCHMLADIYLIFTKSKVYKSKGGSCDSFATHLTVVEPESHVLLLDAESLGQVEVDVLDGAHAAEAACVGQHPLQRSVGGWHVTCWSPQRRHQPLPAQPTQPTQPTHFLSSNLWFVPLTSSTVERTLTVITKVLVVLKFN